LQRRTAFQQAGEPREAAAQLRAAQALAMFVEQLNADRRFVDPYPTIPLKFFVRAKEFET